MKKITFNFKNYVKQNTPKVYQIIGDVANVIGGLASAGALSMIFTMGDLNIPDNKAMIIQTGVVGITGLVIKHLTKHVGYKESEFVSEVKEGLDNSKLRKILKNNLNFNNL